MLGKLLKYEFRSTVRLFLPIYCAALVFALISRVFLSVGSLQTLWNGMLFGIIVFIYAIIIIMASVLTFVLIVQRFYKNLLCDEGYLSHTLPVSIDTHIWGKTIPAAIWNIVCVVVIFASISILLIGEGIFSFFSSAEWATFVFSLNITVDASVPILIFELIVLFIAAIVSSVLSFYAAMSVGHLSGKHRVLMSIVAYFALGTIFSILSSLALSVFLPDAYITSVTTSNISNIMIVSIILQVVGAAIYYAITRYILLHKLNLE